MINEEIYILDINIQMKINYNFAGPISFSLHLHNPLHFHSVSSSSKQFPPVHSFEVKLNFTDLHFSAFLQTTTIKILVTQFSEQKFHKIVYVRKPSDTTVQPPCSGCYLKGPQEKSGT